MPCNDFIFSEELPPRSRLPRAWFGPVRCAGGRTRPRPRSPQVAAASGRKGLAAGEGLGLPKPGGGDRSAETAGLGGLSSRAPPPSIPERGEARVRGRFATPRADAGGGPADRSGRTLPGAPARRNPVPGLRPAAQCALPAAWPWPPGPCPSRAAGHPRRGQWRPRGPAPRRSQPATPSAFQALGASPSPRETLYLPPPPPPSRRRYPWRLGTVPSSGPRGCLPSVRVLPAAERALGLNPASLEEEEEEEGQSGLARTASPYSPFNSLVLSCCGSSRPLLPSPAGPSPPRLRGAAVAAAAAATFSCNTPSLLSSR